VLQSRGGPHSTEGTTMAKSGYRAYNVRVTRIDRLTPNFIRVTFGSDELASLGWDGPDQRIKVVLPLAGRTMADFPTGDDWYLTWRDLPEHDRHPFRTYTIRRADAGQRELVVDFVAHGDFGPASRWVGSASIGDELMVLAPDATAGDAGGYEWKPGNAKRVLIAGDETAAPAICAIVESLPSDASGAVFLEVPTSADSLELAAPAGVAVTWLPRNGHDRKHGDLLRESVGRWADDWTAATTAVEATPVEDPSTEEVLWEVPTAPQDDGLYAWLAGEASAITAIRRDLVSVRRFDRKRVAFMGYWRAGRAEA
jgi:NADPH-dependent ferric siderophore reductase